MKARQPRPRPDSTPLSGPTIMLHATGQSPSRGTLTVLTRWIADTEAVAVAALDGYLDVEFPPERLPGVLQYLAAGAPLWPREQAPTPRTRQAASVLLHVAGFRGALEAGDAVQAASEALQLGVLAEALHAAPFIVAGAGYLDRQQARAVLGRGGSETLARNLQILAWDVELACYPKGRPRERYERVRLIHGKCQKTYHDRRAEAHAARDKAGETAAAVWNIGEFRIDQLLPRKTKKNS